MGFSSYTEPSNQRSYGICTTVEAKETWNPMMVGLLVTGILPLRCRTAEKSVWLAVKPKRITCTTLCSPFPCLMIGWKPPIDLRNSHYWRELIYCILYSLWNVILSFCSMYQLPESRRATKSRQISGQQNALFPNSPRTRQGPLTFQTNCK